MASLVCPFTTTFAQTINWNTIDSSKHMIHAGIGWDYSLSYHLGYSYRIEASIPLLLNASISAPAGEKVLDDVKTKIGGQVMLLDRSHLKGSVGLHAMYRRFENPLVRLQNIGVQLTGVFGYYQSKWFLAGEFGFDKAMSTHFKHSSSYKEYIYSEVKDGWYSPSSGGNFLYGIQTGYSFQKCDMTFNIGKITMQDFKTTPLIPFYMTLGCNYKLN